MKRLLEISEGISFLITGPYRDRGNHTDLNHGKVLAGSINLDCVGAAALNYSSHVRIISPKPIIRTLLFDLNDLEPSAKSRNS